jgi:hypothetical protein
VDLLLPSMALLAQVNIVVSPEGCGGRGGGGLGGVGGQAPGMASSM